MPLKPCQMMTPISAMSLIRLMQFDSNQEVAMKAKLLFKQKHWKLNDRLFESNNKFFALITGWNLTKMHYERPKKL